MFDITNIDQKIKFFNDNVLKIFDAYAPEKSVVFSKKYSPWITPVIKIMQNLRNKAMQRFKRTRLPAHWDFYKQLRNYTNKATEVEKKAYLRQRFENSSVKEKWQELKRLSVFRREKPTIPAHLADPDLMNDFFVDRNPDITDNELLRFYSRTCYVSGLRFLFKQVSQSFVAEIILRISSRAKGHDGINIDILGLCCPFLIPHITHIVNYCLEHSLFPEVWKKAIVTPLPKISSPSELKHLRSISILPTMSKILERVMEQQIRDFLNKHGVISSAQSGFRPGYSCATALCSVTDDIYRSHDENEITVLILIDYSKAFDMINHEILLSILMYIGFDDKALNLMRSYLADRSQAVAYNNRMSESLGIIKGVPQGSILGPLLFSIYTSFLHDTLKVCKHHLYADDTQLYCSFPIREMQKFAHEINEDLDQLHKTAIRHGLKINPSKSSVVVFGSRRHRDLFTMTHQVRMGGDVIPYRESVRNLGVVMDNDLRFRGHVNTLLGRAYMSLKMLYPHRRSLPRDIKIMLCDSIVLSHFNYCDTVYGPCLDNADVRRIQKAQNSCLRFIYGIKRPKGISHKLADTKWLSMHNRRELHMACFYHKILMHKTPPYLFDRLCFRTDVHNVNIRRKDLLTIPKHRKELFKRSFSYNVARVLNKVTKTCDVLSVSHRHVKEAYRRYLCGLQ